MTESQAQLEAQQVVKYLKLIDGITAVKLEQALKVLCPPKQRDLHFEEVERNQQNKQKVLDALRKAGSAGMSNTELNEICFRYGARIFDLRREGYQIKSV